jgi:hypothetical protein
MTVLQNTKKKLIEVALPLEEINKGGGQREVRPARASERASSLVGATAASGVPGGAVRAACR